MADNKIMWEKWEDPFQEAENDDVDGGYKDSYERAENERFQFLQRRPKFAITNLGIIPVNEYNRPSNIFNFWVGHTNFNISTPIIELIESIEGVELLDIFTRYRFRVSIGKLFKDTDVRTNISAAVSEYLKKLDASIPTTQES